MRIVCVAVLALFVGQRSACAEDPPRQPAEAPRPPDDSSRIPRVEARWTEMFVHESWIDKIAFSPDGKTLASASVNIKLWDPKTGAKKGVFRLGYAIGRIAFTPDGKGLLSYPRSGTGDVKRWDLTGMKKHRALVEGRVGWFAVAPDGTTLAVEHADDLLLWDLATAKSKAVLERHTTARVWEFSRDGKTLAAEYPDEIVKFWDVDRRKVRATLRAYEKHSVGELALSPDGKLLATTISAPPRDPLLRDIKLWDLERMKEIRTLKGVSPWEVGDPVFSPDGRVLAAADGRNVTLWDVSTGKVKSVLMGDILRLISSVAFSPDGKMVAAGTTYTTRPLKDAMIKVWDVPRQEDESE